MKNFFMHKILLVTLVCVVIVCILEINCVQVAAVRISEKRHEKLISILNENNNGDNEENNDDENDENKNDEKDNNKWVEPTWLNEHGVTRNIPNVEVKRETLASRSMSNMTSSETNEQVKVNDEVRIADIKKVMRVAEMKGEKPDEEVLQNTENRHLSEQEIEERKPPTRDWPHESNVTEHTKIYRRLEKRMTPYAELIKAKAAAALAGLSFPKVNLSVLLDPTAPVDQMLSKSAPTSEEILQNSQMSQHDIQLIRQDIHQVNQLVPLPEEEEEEGKKDDSNVGGGVSQDSGSKQSGGSRGSGSGSKSGASKSSKSSSAKPPASSKSKSAPPAKSSPKSTSRK